MDKIQLSNYNSLRLEMWIDDDGNRLLNIIDIKDYSILSVEEYNEFIKRLMQYINSNFIIWLLKGSMKVKSIKKVDLNSTDGYIVTLQDDRMFTHVEYAFVSYDNGFYETTTKGTVVHKLLQSYT